MKIDNIYLRAFAKTILFGASIHLFLLAIFTVMRGDFTILNIFNILDLDLFFPELAQGVLLFFLSYVALGVVFVYFFSRDKDK